MGIYRSLSKDFPVGWLKSMESTELHWLKETVNKYNRWHLEADVSRPVTESPLQPNGTIRATDVSSIKPLYSHSLLYYDILKAMI